MHELSIAYELVNIAEEALKDADVKQVNVVHLKLGLLAGVVKDALHFGYDIAIKDTLLEGSRLEIEDVPVVVFCHECKVERILDTIQIFRCPVCNSPTGDIRQGKELELVSLECEDENNEAPYS